MIRIQTKVINHPDLDLSLTSLLTHLRPDSNQKGHCVLLMHKLGRACAALLATSSAAAVRLTTVAASVLVLKGKQARARVGAGQGGGGVGGRGSQYSLLYSARPLPCMCLVQPQLHSLQRAFLEAICSWSKPKSVVSLKISPS